MIRDPDKRRVVERESSARFRRTSFGWSCHVWSGVKYRSRQGGYPAPDFQDLSDFRCWVFGNPSFYPLWDAYVRSGFSRWLAPSIDRLDTFLGYSPSNIRLVTWRENLDAAHSSRVKAFGSELPQSKLCEEDVLNIRRRVSSGETQRSLSREYRLSPCAMWKVVHGHAWSRVGGTCIPVRPTKPRGTGVSL